MWEQIEALCMYEKLFCQKRDAGGGEVEMMWLFLCTCDEKKGTVMGGLPWQIRGYEGVTGILLASFPYTILYFALCARIQYPHTCVFSEFYCCTHAHQIYRAGLGFLIKSSFI